MRLSSFQDKTIRVPVTQTVIYGWYDNERSGLAALTDMTQKEQVQMVR